MCEDGSRHYYRKSHLTEREAQWAEAGDRAGLVLDRPYGRIGVLLGNEIFIKFGIAQVESIFVNHPVASAKMVTDSVTDYRSSCNLNHEAWGNPWDPTRVSTASFVDLFHETLDKCSRVYALLNSAVTDNMPLDKQDLSPLLAELGNESYHSGLPVE